MIDIIKRGTREKLICKECGCYFSFDEEDIESTIDIWGNDQKTIRCPQCETVILLESTK